jgi:PKD repeat protein
VPESPLWEDPDVDRRAFIGRLVALAGASYLAPSLLRPLSAGGAVVAGNGPYGPLGAADANGIQLPAGFTSRRIGSTNQAVAGTGYTWHSAPDGGACFAVAGGGWVYVSNSEMPGGTGGASAVRFDAAGNIAAAYRILTGTSRNCAGGATPWGTWLSCEEAVGFGRVHECDPQQPSQGVVRPLLGTFNHEAAAVDAVTGHVYLTEDDPSGRLYRFTPTTPGNLAAGSLFAANLSGSTVTWVPVSTTTPDRSATTTSFNGGEGAWISDRTLWFTTKGDGRVWELDLDAQQLVVLYDDSTTPGGALNGVDNITVHEPSGDLFVAEDGGNLEVCLITTAEAVDVVAPFLRFVGHSGSEVTGPAFSPDGTRLYVSSQRGTDGTTGVTYEIIGPFRTTTEPPPPPPPVLLAQDAFGRTVSNTWGSADLGGAWTLGGAASSYSVSGGVGRIVLASAGLSRATTLASVSAADVDLTIDATFDKAPTGSGTSVALVARKVGTTEYRMRVQLRTTSRQLQLSRVVSGAETTIASVNLPGGAYPPGQLLHLRFLVVGTGSAALSGKAWIDGSAEPASWQVQAIDSTAALQRPGGVGVQAYVASSITNAPVTVTTDSFRATTPGSGPPPNADPTAAFVVTPTGLSVNVDGSSSTDSDGSIATYAWTFGDGGTASGPSPTAAHTYASAGTYMVTLTVTDDDGATDTASQSVTVTDPGAVVVVAQDLFGRTLTSSWGAADLGGAWTLGGTASNYSVGGGIGRIALTAGGLSRLASLNSVSVADVDATIDLSLDKTPTGSGASVALMARKVGTSGYRLVASLRPTTRTLQVTRLVNGAETVIASAALPGGGYSAGQVLHLRFRVLGSGPAALAGKAWFDGSAEPASWQVQTTDATGALQQPGGMGVYTYLSSSTTNAPVIVSADNLRAIQP